MNLIFSLLFFIVYTAIIALVIIYLSSRLGTALMILIPLIGTIVTPEKMAEFFAFELFSPMNGVVSICNIHILLALWAGFLSVVIYTEFLDWYLRYSSKNEEEVEE